MAGIRAQQKARRPGEILAAALIEFVENGYAATRLEDVAARAKVTKGTIYFYFASKEQLFEAVIHEQASTSLCRVYADDPEWTDDIRADIVSYLNSLYRIINEDVLSRESLRLMIAEARRFPALIDQHFQEFMRPIIEQLERRLELASASDPTGGPAKFPELPTFMLAPILAANVITLMFDQRRPFDLELFRQTHLDVLLTAILPSRASGPGKDGVATLGVWGEWRLYPDPRGGEPLAAPVGAGAFDLRLTHGERIVMRASRNIAADLAALASSEAASGLQPAMAGLLPRHLGELEYRTVACGDWEEAVALVEKLDQTGYGLRYDGAWPSRMDRAGNDDDIRR